jgi:hypothetical protein
LLGNIGLIAALSSLMNSPRIDFETPVSAALNNACADACNVARSASDIAR